tara:strand:+ start:1075 stop:1506 length:432 start_codon:yes stop_codon:yes gene_type:complete
MSNWDKKLFIEDLRNNCNREIAKIGVSIIEFSEQHGTDLSWGRGSEYGTLTYRCESDEGALPLFHMTSKGQLNIQINFMRNKGIPPMVILDIVLKLESNFLRDYDEEGYSSDVFIPMEELFHTQSQVDKFIKTMEGATYRLKQ